MGFGGFWMLLLLALPVVLLVYLLRGPERPRSSGSEARSAVEAARERYARGEIDRETYQRLVRDLEG